MLKLAGLALSILLLSVTGILPYVDAQTQKYLSYENKQYGFTIKYPSSWEKTDTIAKSSIFPNVLDIVTFSTSSGLTNYGVSLIRDDPAYKGLGDQKFLDKIKKDFVDSFCSKVPAGVACSTELLQQTTVTNPNGYSGYMIIYIIKVSSNQGSSESTIGLGFYPNGNDVWMVGVGGRSNDELQQYANELAAMGSSFTISDYVVEKQFLLQSKAAQKNDVVYLVIKNPNDSTDDVYSIKLTNTNGKITNYIKVKDWTNKRVGPDSVMYQTIISPLDSSDVIKVALKVDSKNTEIQWEAFSKDQKSLGTGKVKS